MSQKSEIPERGKLDLKYLERSSEQNRKDYFAFVIDIARESLSKSPGLRILDTGCATGAFLRELSNSYPQHAYYGLDILSELISRASVEVPKATFINGDLCSELSQRRGKFDIIFANGIHSMFNDLNLLLSRILGALSEGGQAYIFGPFNPEPLDVIVNVFGDNLPDIGIKGWNLFSLKTVCQLGTDLGFRSQVSHYTPDSLERSSSDPLASWVVDVPGYGRVLLNGIQQLQHMYALTFSRI
jgi:trans-aconitate methyltransferase